MSGTLNKVMLIGHLGDEVKLHYFEGGNCIGRFPIATNESYTNRQTGEKVTNTEWHNIVVRNKAAEVCEKYLGKGDLIYVEGRLKTRQWQGEDGNTRYTTEIQATDFTFLSNRNDPSGNPQGNPQARESSPGRTPEPKGNERPAPVDTPDEEDDLPF
ncbi:MULTISPECIES: single-stranded DNA-binding protein [Robiginitalea]|uniref:single-stranded DNA-binding protein n=1 Tax=Robiginitalea TaxID=252306 RepID=UPI0023497AB6|nr:MULTISPECIES: single-stranded DNA-binding protein [unclassified Robiginitalea]MDC6352952.1 single-stranded DNA-binding protein [Robiginitalea sp. PM2]MDC6373881.1 single-stranded DNA-binding protein [Robiginitalea sp. SP8]